ncbi:MAG: hypothetical protein AVDCRST_MAG56-978 [uncultured Cytophagales bacterium]|uniref:Uncharacterized protein n=1 Tax=uncultured Cytophagales bacterium TaxID=158755 RepID=A0A6J4HN02_9SPHI|nr:MAG: hypothetical protein AVDCRST_MAG56-978 [uncultured Cytophagales bacterium]
MGQCQKEQTPLTHLQPFTIPLQTIPIRLYSTTARNCPAMVRTPPSVPYVIAYVRI